MFVNNFIYFYIGICILLIAFEVIWGEYIKIYNIKFKKMKIKYKEQIIAFGNGEAINIDVKSLSKKLRNVNNLIAFQSAYEEATKRKRCKGYVYKILPVLEELNVYYSRKKSDMEKSYFAYVLGKDLRAKNIDNIGIFIETLYEFLNSKSTSCRVNSMNAICSIGGVDNVKKATRIISNIEYEFNEILLANCLKSFRGDKAKLADELFNDFNNYKENVQCAIMIFLIEVNSISDKFIVEKLESNSISVNVKCEIMRYFQVNKSELAKTYLIKELCKPNIKANDFIIKAIGTLGYYDDNDVCSLLESLKTTRDEMILETVYRSKEKISENKYLM